MKDKIITITSKNQITIPVDYVRKFKLQKNRQLNITEKKGKIELTPRPGLRERLQSHWDEFHKTHPEFPALSDEEIHDEAGKAYADYFQNKK